MASGRFQEANLGSSKKTAAEYVLQPDESVCILHLATNLLCIWMLRNQSGNSSDRGGGMNKNHGLNTLEALMGSEKGLPHAEPFFLSWPFNHL